MKRQKIEITGHRNFVASVSGIGFQIVKEEIIDGVDFDFVGITIDKTEDDREDVRKEILEDIATKEGFFMETTGDQKNEKLILLINDKTPLSKVISEVNRLIKFMKDNELKYYDECKVKSEPTIEDYLISDIHFF